MIAARNLTRRFGPRVAVDDVSLDVRRNEIVALLGPNGAGKTTTMRMLAGLIAPSAGSVSVGGVSLTRTTASSIRRRIGFLTEAPGLWDRLSVRENLQVYARLYELDAPDRAIERALDQFELADRATTRAAELSKGMRQKVALVRALLHDPPTLLLDEPMSGLDPEIRRSVRKLLEERRDAGCSILVSTHNLDEAERLADRVAVLDRRLLALDRPRALRQRLMTGRVIVRVAGDPAAFLTPARSFDPSATVDAGSLIVRVSDIDQDSPALVSTLVTAGARILEVRPEMPALEDVYLHLMSERS
ncbi:MAG TPA: ABC transporter ATP-binding protein [Vicinamibacterales bacterium]|jgi:ABC-2 type transport system ATP-binding protein